MTPSEFRAAIPAFASSPPDDPTIQRWLDASDPYFDQGRWDTLYPDGVANWVAHKIVLEAATGKTMATAGQTSLATGKKVGSEQINYSDKIIDLMAKNPYMRTIYGQVFLELRSLVGLGAVAV